MDAQLEGKEDRREQTGTEQWSQQTRELREIKGEMGCNSVGPGRWTGGCGQIGTP